MKRSLSALVFACIAGASYADGEQVVYSNLGPNLEFDAGASYAINGTDKPAPQVIAHQFTSALSGQFAFIMTPLFDTGHDSALNVALLHDDGAGNVGSLMKNFHFGPPPAPTLCTVHDGLSGLRLEAGQQYWIRVSGDPDFDGGWNLNSTGAIGRQAVSTDGGSSYSYFDNVPGAAFMVGVIPDPVPEPATLSILGLGALALLRRRRR